MIDIATIIIDDTSYSVVSQEDVTQIVTVAEQGLPGPIGHTGKSAYESAVERGYVGTESDWINQVNLAQGTLTSAQAAAATATAKAAEAGATVATIQQSATNAATSEQAAAQHATDAATSLAQANTAKNTATTQAGIATTKAGEAAASATAAATQAGIATTKAAEIAGALSNKLDSSLAGAANGLAQLDGNGVLKDTQIPATVALKTDVPSIIVKEEGTQIASQLRSLNLVGAQMKGTSDNAGNVTLTFTDVNIVSVAASSSPGIVPGQLLKITLSGAAMLTGGSIAKFTVTPSWTAEFDVVASGNAATTTVLASGSIGSVLTYTVVAVDNLGNVSKPITKSVNVVTNSAPTGSIVVNAPTEVTSASIGNQISFTGLVDNDGTTFTYTIVNDSVGSAYVFSKLTGIADGEIVTFTAPDLGTNGSDTPITFHVKAVDSLGAQTATVAVTVKTILSHVIGVVLKSTGAGATWGQVDVDGNDIPQQPASYFNSNPPWQLTDVTIDGQAMVRMPKFYVKSGVISGGVNNGKSAWWVSDLPRAGFVVHPAFNVGGVTKDYLYVGKYMGSLESATGKLMSVATSNYFALPNNVVTDNIYQYGTARNVNGVTGFDIVGIWQASAIAWLYLVENCTMASSKPYHYRNLYDICGDTETGTLKSCFIDGATASGGGMNIWDIAGNKSYADDGALGTDIFNTYPVTFVMTGRRKYGFFAATATGNPSNATVADSQWNGDPASMMWGSGAQGGAENGLFAFSARYTSSATNIGIRLIKF